MKIALISPPYPLEESPSPPLGLCYVAAACEAAGAQVILIDYIVEKYTPEKLAVALNAFQPHVVGITSVTMNFYQAIKIIQDVKHMHPEIITMMGGPHVTFDIENTLKRYSELDLIVYGESEATLLELIPRLSAPYHNWENIRGIAFRRGYDVMVTPKRPLIDHIDELCLPSRHLLPMSRYQALGFPVTIITSRGCPNRCIFCLGRRMVGHKARFRDPKLVVDEIEDILDYGITRINIADDLFTANKRRVKALCDEIIRRRVNFGWSAFARVNTVDLEMLTNMKSAGCDTISYGIESGNPEILKRVKKGITLNQTKNAVMWSKQAGLRTHASFMVGLPGESRETLNRTQHFAESLNIEYGYHFLSPFPGTTIRESIDQYDLQILTNDWNLYDANQAIVETSQLSAKEMDAFVQDVYQRFEEGMEDTRTRYHEGRCTDEEFLRMEGHYHMHLIYKLLSEDLVDNQQVWPLTDNDYEPEASFVASIIQMTQMDAAMVERSIKNLILMGYLGYRRVQNGIKWFWTHNNKVERLVIK
ncbi:MAG: radical SAM protein [Desulfobacteraceae bacterium]|jgi:radical SAM superfamily enzyme YgiQ (UPF0313 family)